MENVNLNPKDVAGIEQSLALTMFGALQAGIDRLRSWGWNRELASQWVDFLKTHSEVDKVTSHLLLGFVTLVHYANY